MGGEKELHTLLKTMKPKLNDGDYVFCTVPATSRIDLSEIVMVFNEHEAITVVLKKERADKLNLSYTYIASWITLTVHSSLEAVGFTATFSKALSDANISTNVVAAFFHDHLFVDKKDAQRAMEILNRFSE